MTINKAVDAETVAKEHLVRLLLDQLDRTFSTEGHAAGLRMVGDMLRRLDAVALREYAYLHGLVTEHDLEPEQEANRAGSGERSE